jgi:hypothetical protein
MDFEQTQEMAMIGKIEGPKTGKYLLEVFSDEYENESPYFNLELPQKESRLVVAKVEITANQPALDDEPNILWVRDGYTLSNQVKEEIAKWLVAMEDGITGWQKAKMLWAGQAESKSWGPISFP